MIHFRAPLLGGLCCVGLICQFAAVDIVHATTTVEMQDISDDLLRPSAEYVLPIPADEAAADFGYDAGDEEIDVAAEDAAPAATTEFYGDSASQENPAWAAPAKMNPDYAGSEPAVPSATDAGVQSEPSENAASGETTPTQVAEDATPPATGGQATTEYYGGTEAPSNPAWAAPAKMNPDYVTDVPAASGEPAQPAAAEAPANAASPESAPAQAAEEAPPPPTGGQATTEFYGDSPRQENPAWASPAKMNPDYVAAAPAGSLPAAEAPAAGTPAACVGLVEAAAKAALLHFGEDSTAIAQDSRGKLAALAAALKDCGGVIVGVHGYTDSVGPDEANQVLSERRAKKIVDFLTGAGVDAARLKAIGDGKANPIADNGTAEGRRMNRRVEFSVSVE